MTTTHTLPSLRARFHALLTGRVEIETPRAVPPPTTQLAACSPLLPPPSSVTLNDWRSSTIRVDYVRALLAAPTFRELLSTIAAIRPYQRTALDATSAAYMLGWRTGQDIVLQAILDAGTGLATQPADVPADYGASESEFAADPNAETQA